MRNTHIIINFFKLMFYLHESLVFIPLVNIIYYLQSNEEREFENIVNGYLNPDAGKLVKPAPGRNLIVLYCF